MAGFRNLKAIIDADVAGDETMFSFRKTPAVVTTAGTWFDMSMSPGNPIPNYYANTPLKAAVLTGSEGIFHGGSVSPATKHIRDIMVLSNSGTGLPLRFVLMDYLLYYPFVDQGRTDEQAMDNTVTLPRYATGDGVQIMAVLVGAQTGGQQFTVKYTNQAGVTGRVTPAVTCNTATFNGAIATTATATNGCAGPFIPLQAGDTGVRAIESVTMLGADVGLMTFVLVKTIQCFQLRGVDAPVEVSFVMDRPGMARIIDGAYLNLLVLPNGSLSSVSVHGLLTTTWN
jgi:hypothetical protein